MVQPLLEFPRNRGYRLPKALPNQEEGSRPPSASGGKFRISGSSGRWERLAQQGTALARSPQNASPVADLARFFPDATAMRIPVQFARLHETGQPADFSENTVIEFGTPREVLFASKIPLDFADVLKLRNSDGSFEEEARVVAVQYHPENTLVAARFSRDVPNWIVKP